MSFTVKFSPDASQIGTALRKRIDQIPDALYEFAQGQAGKMEGYARENAPWIDDTTAAREGIYGQAIREGGKITIVIYATATDMKTGYEYPKVLELGAPPRDGHPGVAPRPILAPTLAAHQTETLEQAKRIVMSLLGGKLV